LVDNSLGSRRQKENIELKRQKKNPEDYSNLAAKFEGDSGRRRSGLIAPPDIAEVVMGKYLSSIGKDQVCV